MFQYEIESAFINLLLALNPVVLPVLGDVCSSLLFFPWDIYFQACCRPGSCSSVAMDKVRLASLILIHWCCCSLPSFASCTSTSLVVSPLIWFSFSLSMPLKTYSWLLERVKMPCYHFSHTHIFLPEVMTFWLYKLNNKVKMGYDRSQYTGLGLGSCVSSLDELSGRTAAAHITG